MVVKSRVTQELANAFPDWAKLRSDDQSVGKSLLNVFGIHLETLETEIARGYDNMYLSTAYVGEIDQLYKLELPSTYEFATNNANNLSPIILSPTISGLVDSTWYAVTEVENGSIRELWYDALPSRISEVTSFDIDNYLVASGLSTDVELMLVGSGLDLDNVLTVVVEGEQQVIIDADGEVQRSKVRITGETWKETNETEDVVFLFNDSKQTFKAWNLITKVEPVNFVSDSAINVYSHRFNQPRYLDTFESMSQFDDSRENLPCFWALSENQEGYSVLELQRFTTQKAVHLLTQRPEYIDVRRWELLNEDDEELEILDIAQLPYQQKLLAITEDTLYIYDTLQELPNLKVLTEKTSNALVDIYVSSDYNSRSDNVEVACLFQRPIKTIIRHRLKIEYPDGSTFGILADGTLVPTNSDYWVREETSDRFIRPSIFIELDDVGQHNLTLECVYLDETTDIAQRAILVLAKNPLATYDLTSITDAAVGIDVDHQNRVLILDSGNTVHQVMFRYDFGIIDYENKEILFRENYDEVKVIKE
jgi:hypothetical protein